MPVMPAVRRTRFLACLSAVLILAAVAGPAVAQARNPFSVGISEGGGSPVGVVGWLLAQQGWLEHRMALGIRAAKLGSAGLWPLMTVSLVYGVFHAAGPGHGKAVLAAYMVANERALRRGMLLSFAAALLQGLVALVLISMLTLLLHATAPHVRATASGVEIASFAVVAGLGLQLVWRKGRALRRAWSNASWPGGSVFPASGAMRVAAPGVGTLNLSVPLPRAARFACEPADTAHAADCLHCLGADPRALTGPRFDVRQALVTVLAAGLRPCSGAILVLVFAAAQGFYAAGVLSVLAMSLGVAVTTSALAASAVLFKATMARIAGRRSPRAALAGAAIEFLAACAVLSVGVLLLTGYAAAGMS